jgi:hypothetical protein
MRITRQLFHAIALALVVVALSAGSTSAATVTVEATGVACPALTTTGGGCAFHVAGEVDYQGHVFGVEQTTMTCNMELVGRFGGNGAGKVDSATFTDHAGVNDCTRVPCNLPWDVAVTGSSGAYALSWTLCQWPGEGGNPQVCTVSVPLTAVGHAYSSSFHARTAVSSPVPCELEGQLVFEGTGFEIVD